MGQFIERMTNSTSNIPGVHLPMMLRGGHAGDTKALNNLSGSRGVTGYVALVKAHVAAVEYFTIYGPCSRMRAPTQKQLGLRTRRV